MRRWRNGAAAAVATLAVAMVGCAGGGQPVESGAGSAGTAQVLGVSTTPGPDAGAAPTLRHDLISISEVRQHQAFGFDLREVPLVDPSKWDVTVVTGACGARISSPFQPGQDSRVFFSTVSLIVETSAPWDDKAKATFAAAQADLTTGCPSFADPTAFGAPVQLTGTVDLGRVGTERLGWTQSVAATGRTAMRQVALVHDESRLVMLAAVVSPAGPTERFAELAQAAFAPGAVGTPATEK
jgi:hypothetical protein